MTILICGPRHFEDILIYKILAQVMYNLGVNPDKIISGGARGVDTYAKQYAERYNIPFQEFKPDWKKYGKGAGHVRNQEMVDIADMVVALWDGKSKGTKSTIDKANKKGIPVVIEMVTIANEIKQELPSL